MFSLLESFFFLCLGISFVLILLMVQYFKKRLDSLEKSNEALGDICKTIVSELNTLKRDTPPPSFSPKESSVQVNSWNQEQELFKKIIVSEHLLDNSIPDPLDIGILYENEDFDDVESCEDESGESDSCDESEDDMMEEIQDVEINIEDNVFYVTKLDTPTVDYSEIDGLLPSIDTSQMNSFIGKILEETVKEVLKNNDDIEIEELPVEVEEEEIKNESLEENPEETLGEVQNHTKTSLQKMNIQMLKTMVIRDGICTDPSKYKKQELIQLILDQ
jgi:hypothetical protein